MISPFVNRKEIDEESGMSYGLQPCSYDMRCREEVTIGPATVWNSIKQAFGYGHPTFVLISTIETVQIPDFLMASVHDKSSWARRGVVVQNTHFDPGFRGVPTIEITNHGSETIQLKKGTPICQLIFHKLDQPSRAPYSGKYQDQQAGPQYWRKDHASQEGLLQEDHLKEHQD
jgi:dCTP deaminase